MGKYNSLSDAVWLTKKRVPAFDGQTQRWLDHNSEIRLTLKRQTSRNAEFYVNNNQYHTIWYSQFAAIFIEINTLDFYSAVIYKKDGGQIPTCEMSLNDFLTFIKGRTFRVVVNNGEIAAFDDSQIPFQMPYVKVREVIADLIKKEDYEEAARYLKPATIYDLIEI